MIHGEGHAPYANASKRGRLNEIQSLCAQSAPSKVVLRWIGGGAPHVASALYLNSSLLSVTRCNGSFYWVLATTVRQVEFLRI